MGEAPKGLYGFIDLDQNEMEGRHAIFPILKQVEGGNLQPIGTGFFISSFGVFLSAKHVLRECIDDNNDQKYPICICQFFQDHPYRFRTIIACAYHTVSDVAVGILEPNDEIPLNPVLRITTSTPSIGSTDPPPQNRTGG